MYASIFWCNKGSDRQGTGTFANVLSIHVTMENTKTTPFLHGSTRNSIAWCLRGEHALLPLITILKWPWLYSCYTKMIGRKSPVSTWLHPVLRSDSLCEVRDASNGSNALCKVESLKNRMKECTNFSWHNVFQFKSIGGKESKTISRRGNPPLSKKNHSSICFSHICPCWSMQCHVTAMSMCRFIGCQAYCLWTHF